MATRLLDLFCSQCGAHIVEYRKEGSGSLIRLYLDRIIGPAKGGKWEPQATHAKTANLVCRRCENLIGIPMTGEGKRPAFRLIKGSFRRKAK
ncbi:MAG: hypothetical protein ACE5E9_14415 [Nitrospinaceae bacterium]